MIRRLAMAIGQIGLGLDFSLGMTFEDQQTLAREAAGLGYQSLWTPEGAGLDSFHLCALRNQASGLATGIGVCPIAYRSPVAFAMSAGTVSAMSGGKFSLGIGSGGIYRADARRQLGLPRRSTLAVMREYTAAVKGLLSGESVTIEGEAVQYDGVQLGFRPPPTPVLVGALGPQMIQLGAEVGDGAVLNWCDPERVSWSRDRLNEGAARAGKRPEDVQLVEYIRICVDEDVETARMSYAKSMLGYALGQEVPSERLRKFAYRAHFERMGFTDELASLDDMRRSGASADDVATAASEELLTRVGYYGNASGAKAGFEALADGLDTAIVRVVAARPGLDAVRAVMRACAPNG
ncbi:MAG: LLM class flavin-dependent oxidoreductase [Chloroflexi bacterium]|nr:LLM class flavin-dependent oxidoreductase [Chloroflexota bacterium]